VVKWCPWYTCWTHGFKLHPHAPKKFMGHGISHTYAGMHSFFYSEKICKCSEGWSSSCAFCHGIVTLNSNSVQRSSYSAVNSSDDVNMSQSDGVRICHTLVTLSEVLSATLADLL
jgi:hypothetical protein